MLGASPYMLHEQSSHERVEVVVQDSRELGQVDVLPAGR